MPTPAAGQYTTDGHGDYTFAAADAGTTVQITYSYSQPTTTDNGQPLEALSFTFFPGERPQTPWGYLTSKHPSEALAYAGLAYLGCPSLNLGVSGTLPNLNYEVVGLLPFGGGILDANPPDVLSDIWSDVNHGLGLDPSFLGDLTQWSNYCVANGLFLSPVLDSQEAASELLQELLDVTNSNAAWYDGKLNIIPYGDTTAVGNGVTFTPQTDPVYDLSDDDFVGEPGEDPVQISRVDLADTFNAVKIEWLDRSNQYNTSIIEEKNETSINLHGLREDNVRTYHSITTQAVAAMAANAILKRNIYIVASYKWKTDWRYSLLTPMDLVTLTVPAMGLNATPVRITRIVEHSDGTLEFEAEEFPWGTATATEYPKEPGAPYIPQSKADPGFVNAPIVFESTSRQANYQGFELNIAVSGASANWGGANVWASVDGTSYQQIGQIKNGASMGVLSAALAAGSDPDTSNTLAVDLTESLGQLISATNAEADANQTLCWVDGELIAFGTATLTAASKYNLTYLRRGIFGTANAAHSSGAAFARLDGAIFTFELDPGLVGKTLHLKFTSFNAYGRQEQSLASVTDYTHVIAGSGPGLITPTGTVGAGGVTWASLSGDTTGDTSTPIADAGNKRLTHAGMSTGVQAVVSSGGGVNVNPTGGVSGQLPQPNHDPTVLLSAVTGTQRNAVPDSDLKFGFTYWTQANAACVIAGGGVGGNNCFSLDINANSDGATVSIAVNAGQTYTLSAFVDANGMSAGYCFVGVRETGGTLLLELDWNAGTSSRQSGTFTVPSGQSAVVLHVGQWAATGSAAGTALASCFQIEPGSAATAYRPNVADDATGHLLRGAHSPEFVSAIDTGGIATAGAVDFSRGYTGKHLGNIPDDSGSSRFAVLAIDGNRRAIIDGSSSHVNWTQDHLPDGGTYRRVANVASDNTFHSSTSFLAQGSMAPAPFDGVAFPEFNTGTGQIDVKVTTAGKLYRTNGTTISVPTSTTSFSTWAGQTVDYPAPPSGTTTNTSTFWCNICWDPVGNALVIQQVEADISDSSGVITAHPSAQLTAARAALAVADGLIPIIINAAVELKTTGDGTGGGTNADTGDSGNQPLPYL